MWLHSLLRQFDPQLSLSGIPDTEITGVCDDSRRVVPGNLFIARPGNKTSGQQFISDAKSRGAVAVVCDGKSTGCALPQIVVKDVVRATAILANFFHSSPSQKM